MEVIKKNNSTESKNDQEHSFLLRVLYSGIIVYVVAYIVKIMIFEITNPVTTGYIILASV